MKSGYAGTVTQSATTTLTITTGGFTQAAGTFTDGGSASTTIDINDGAFTLSGGTFSNTGTSGSFTVERNFTLSGGTFTNTSNTVTFDGADNADDTTVACTSIDGTVSFNKSTTAAGGITINSGCTVPLGASPTSAFGIGTTDGLTNNGTITIASGTWTVNASSANSSSDTPLTNNGTLTHSGNGWDLNDVSFTNASGATTTYSGTSITIERSFTQSGTFGLTGMTVTFDGTHENDNATITCSGTLGGTSVFTKGDGTTDSGGITIASGCTVPLGASPTSRIGLEAAGVKTTERGYIAVDPRCRTNVPSISAIGDVTGPPFLAHRASKQGIIAAEVIAGQPSMCDWQALPAGVFCDPEVATVGLSEAEAKAAGHDVEVGRFPFAALGRALLRVGRAREALEAARRALALDPFSPAALDLLDRARAALQRSR
jgi:hypothetical protein